MCAAQAHGPLFSMARVLELRRVPVNVTFLLAVGSLTSDVC